MARGTGTPIIVSADPQGKFMEGIIGSGMTPKPGTIMQRDASVALKSGRHTYVVYNRDADGNLPAGSYWVLLNDTLQGRAVTTAYAAGERCFLYSPRAGEELNLLLLDVAGTGDDHTIGEILMVDDGTGKLIATTGSPESEVAQLLETVTDPVADTLAWVQWTGQ